MIRDLRDVALEARHPLAAGDQDVDREVHPQALLRLAQLAEERRPLVRRRGEPRPLLLGRADQLRAGDGEHHAVERALRAVLAQQGEEVAPPALVGRAAAGAQHVLAGDVEHHAVVEEPERDALAAVGGRLLRRPQRQVEPAVREQARLARDASSPSSTYQGRR